MSVTRCSYLTLLFLAAAVCGTLSAQTPAALGMDSDAMTPTASAHPKEVYPQIVRLSLVEGDVRVAVGKQKELRDVAPWVHAATNMPLESGFSVVTGKGRVEIEFEDASTMYVGENSALTFDELSAKNNVPYTEMTLLTGVATLHLHPTMVDEMYLLETPTDFIRVPYGRHANLRVNSYTDTTTVTPLSFAETRPDEPAPKQSLSGQTFTFKGETLKPAPPSVGDGAFDAWVAKRVQARAASMHAVMKEANLTEPLPGLADMEAKGTFFACKPYGTCWAPTNGWGGAHAAAGPSGKTVPVSAQVSSQQPQAPSQQQQAQGLAQGLAQNRAQDAKLSQAAQQDEEQAEEQTDGDGGVAPAAWVEDEDAFPCSPYALENLMGLDPVTGDPVVLASDVVWNDGAFDDFGYGFGYDWAVCHAGSWIYRRHRYVWVAGRHRHHHSPVHWVKMNGKQGFVPIHPRDAAGKEPENLRNGIFEPSDRKGGGLERVAFDPGAHVKVLAETPREFQHPSLPMLHGTSAPKVESHALLGAAGGKSIPSTSLIAFDSKARGFTVTTQMNDGGHSHTVVSHVGGGISGSGGRGFSSGGGGGAFGGGSRASSGGGGGSGGGGAAHSSGGGSASSGGASAASGGGGHH